MTCITVTRDGAVAVATLDRPPVNALRTEDYEDIAGAFEQVGADASVNAVVIASASDRAFCAGADVVELRRILEGDPADDLRRQALARRMFAAVRTLPQPTIAAVNGPALGAGAVLAACCDVRVASERATFGLPEVNVGRCGGGRHMMRLLPQGTVRRMVFTGLPIDAGEAFRLGMVDSLHPHGEERTEALRIAELVAAKSPVALRLAKASLNECEGLDVEQGYETEQRYTIRLAATEDGREAVRAFVEKRQPQWSGR